MTRFWSSRSKNKSDVKAVKDAVEKRITSQIEAFDNYGLSRSRNLRMQS